MIENKLYLKDHNVVLLSNYLKLETFLLQYIPHCHLSANFNPHSHFYAHHLYTLKVSIYIIFLGFEIFENEELNIA